MPTKVIPKKSVTVVKTKPSKSQPQKDGLAKMAQGMGKRFIGG